MVYFNKINGNEPVAINKNTAGTTGKTTPQIKVVPVGQNADKQSEDIDKLPQGYYVEKSLDNIPPAQESVSIPTEPPASEPTEAPTEVTTSTETAETSSQLEDLPDTKIHTDERIELTDNITIASDDSKPIQDALDNAIRRSQYTILSNNKEVNYITKAESMIKQDAFQPLETRCKKGWHASGLARFEVNDCNYNVKETGANIKWTSNTERIDLKGTYESNSGNTKLFGYFKGATSQNNTLYEINNQDPEASGDVQPIPDVMNIKSRYNEFCAYMGIKQKLNNGNVLTATGFHDANERDLAHTTEVNALYDLGFANITGSAAVYKLGNAKAAVKTNLSCKLKTFDKPAEQTTTEQTTEEQQAESNTDGQKTQATKTSGKKWDKKGGLLLEFESEDEHKQGIGYYWDFHKNETNSKTKFTVFGKASTTQRGNDETSSYHLTGGANLQYREKISPKYIFDLNLDAKDEVTFGGKDKGNITTAFGTARLASKKLIAELEGKLILAKDTYKALALKLAYKFNPKIEVSVEGAAVNQNESGIKLKGYTALGSLHVNL